MIGKMEKVLFNNFVNSQTNGFCEKLKDKYVEKFPELAFEEIEQVLMQKILQISSSALIKDLHERKNEENSLIKDENKEKEFENYNNLFKKSEYLQSFFAEYPLLEKKLNIIKANFNDYVGLLLDSIIKDAKTVNEELNTDFFKPEELVSLEFDGGDTHNKGKTVTILRFKEGKVVYKPHSLANERFFNSFLSMMNSSTDFGLKTIKNIDFDTYGYQEFIETKLPEKKYVIKEYYRKFGILTAASYFLTITDLHYENILVSYDSPVFFDIETLFKVKDESKEIKSPHLINSVLQTCILPLNFSEVYKDNDLSGLFGCYQYKDVYVDANQITDKFTSDIRVAAEKKKVTKKSVLNEKYKAMDPMDFLDDFLGGFDEGARFLLENKAKVLEHIEENLTEANANRVLLRSTQVYGEFYMALCNANYLKSEQQEQIIFNILYKNETLDKKLIESEIKQLKNGDIPYFYHSVKSRDLRDCDSVVKKNHIKNDLLADLRGHVENITEKDIDFQKTMIEKTFCLVKDDMFTERDSILKDLRVLPRRYSETEVIRACRNYFDRMLKKNLYYSEEASDLSCVSIFPVPATAGMDCDLYENLGILPVLAQFDRMCGTTYYCDAVSKLAKTAFEKLEYKIKHNKDISVSAFSCFGSFIYVSAVLYSVYRDDEFLKQLQKAIQYAIFYVDKAEKSDYIIGVSGMIAGLCKVYKAVNLPIIPLAIDAYAKKLEEMIEAGPEALELDGAGIAHGTAGVMYALILLREYEGETSSDGHCFELIKKIADMTDEKDISALAGDVRWCRGISGATPIFEKLNEMKITDIDLSALHENFENTNGMPLCHGLAGVMASLRYANRTEEYEQLLEPFQASCMESLKTGEFRLRQNMRLYPNAIEGLMMGESGVVYELMASVKRDLPNILYFDI